MLIDDRLIPFQRSQKASSSEQQLCLAAIGFFFWKFRLLIGHTHINGIRCKKEASLILRRIWNANGLEFRLGRAGWGERNRCSTDECRGSYSSSGCCWSCLLRQRQRKGGGVQGLGDTETILLVSTVCMYVEWSEVTWSWDRRVSVPSPHTLSDCSFICCLVLLMMLCHCRAEHRAQNDWNTGSRRFHSSDCILHLHCI